MAHVVQMRCCPRAHFVLVAGGAILAFPGGMAEMHGAANVENTPLTRENYAGVDLDDEVPPEQYRAMAEAIGYVWSFQGRTMLEDRRRI